MSDRIYTQGFLSTTDAPDTPGHRIGELERELAASRAREQVLRTAIEAEARNLAKDAYFCAGGNFTVLRAREEALRAALREGDAGA